MSVEGKTPNSIQERNMPPSLFFAAGRREKNRVGQVTSDHSFFLHNGQFMAAAHSRVALFEHMIFVIISERRQKENGTKKKNGL